MLTKIQMKLDIPEDFNFNINKSSLLHGVIMENISEEYAEKMHGSALKPFSQNVCREKGGNWIWTISALTDDACEQIIKPISELDRFIIKHNSMEIGISGREIIHESYDSLFERNYYGVIQPSKYVTLEMNTPMSFKANGKYINMPDVQLVMANLIRRYDAFSKLTEIYDERLMAELSERLSISSYELRSTVFCLENVKVPAFKGRFIIRVSGGTHLVSLINMLADYAEFSGIGIKTALGMGAVAHIVQNRKED